MSTLPKRPTSADDLAKLVRDSHGPIRIGGACSNGPIDAGDDGLTISTLRMNKVLEHAVPDMTVIAQAGITLEALQRELAWRDQWLPVDPWATGGRTPGQRTLGGLIATNALGPLRYGIGDWRFLLMGVRWVDAQGRLMKGGGRTVKNVAGYATQRLLTGSAGTLGLIAEVTLRTFARPQDEQCVILFAPDAPRAEALLAQLSLAPLTPAYIQVVGGKTFAANPLQLPFDDTPGSMAVVVGFLGRPDSCAAQIATTRALPAAQGLESISQTAAQSGRLRLWMTTEPAADTLSTFRLYLRPSHVAAAVAAVESLETPWVVSEAGTGIVRGSLSSSIAPTHLASLAQRLGTDAWSLRLPAGEFHTSPDPARSITARLKHALDPAAHLSPLPVA